MSQQMEKVRNLTLISHLNVNLLCIVGLMALCVVLAVLRILMIWRHCIIIYCRNYTISSLDDSMNILLNVVKF